MPALIAELQDMIDAIQEDNSIKQTRIKALRREADRALRYSEHFEDAMDVLGHWKQHCYPKAVELGGERLKKVISRLKAGYKVDQLKRCVDGYAAFPYVVEGRRVREGNPARRYVDAELVFRDPKHVDQGLALADEAERRQQPLPTITVPVAREDQLSALGLSAVRLAQFGFHVFPIAPMAKTPVTQHGLLDATRDVERITHFWLEHPEHNVGIRCGIESELVVLDVDGDEGYDSLKELEDHYERLPLTACVKTPRGGEHFYFRHPGRGEVRNTTGFPLSSLDIRGDGGYVLAPPSVGPTGRRYEVDESAQVADLPGWFLRLLVERQASRATLPTDWAEAVKRVIGEGERDVEMTRLVGHLWSHGMDAPEIFVWVSALNEKYYKPPLEEKQIGKIIQSVNRREARKALPSRRTE
jgi:hypothetical protein